MTDIKRLREDMVNECMGAYFGGEFGGACVEADMLENVSDEILIAMALEKGIDLSKYNVTPD